MFTNAKRHLLTITMLAVLSVSTSQAITLVHYDPVGAQNSDSTDLAPTFTSPGIGASDMHNVSPDWHGGNTNVRPTRAGQGPLDLNGGYSFNFTLTPLSAGTSIQLSTIEYSYASYYDQASSFTISLLTSADSFSSVVSSIGVIGGSTGLLTFDASSVAASSNPLEIRFYLHDLVGSSMNWADIVSTNAGGNGLVVKGNVPDGGSTVAFMAVALTGLVAVRRRKVTQA